MTTTLIDRAVDLLRDRYRSTPRWPAHHQGAYLGMGAVDPVFTGAEQACLIIGPPRSGKTTSIIIPALTLWNGPAVTTSTKPDTLHITARRRSGHGQAWVFDPTGRLALPAGVRALHWSPLHGCTDWDTAIDRAWILAHSARPDPAGDALHWTERAGALLACLLHAAALGAQPMSVLLGWIHRRETWEALDHLSVKPCAKVAHDQLTGINATDSRELSGIWSTTDSVLAAYRGRTMLDGADHPNFDPSQFAQSNDTVHVIVPGTRAAQHAPAICALLDQIRHHTLSAAHRPMLWALDEVANVAPLPNLPSIVADAGSQGLLILACLQDLSQARHRWANQADGLLTLFSTTLLLPGIADPNTLRTVTTLAGQVDTPHYSHTRAGLIAGHRTITTRKEPLLPENIVAHGRPDHALCVRATRPSWLRLTPWHNTAWIRSLLEGNEQ